MDKEEEQKFIYPPAGKPVVDVTYHPPYASFAVNFMVEGMDGKRYVAKPLAFEYIEVTPFMARGLAPTFWLDEPSGLAKEMTEALQKGGRLLDSEVRLQGKLDAMTDHLQDMRRLVFNKQEMDAPEEPS